jgi:uncharacterized protein YukE
MAQLGLDPEEMTALSRNMRSEAAKIDSAAKSLDGRLRGVWWKGKDAEKFKGDWQAHRKTLAQVSEALNAAARQIDQNVSQQQQASGA